MRTMIKSCFEFPSHLQFLHFSFRKTWFVETCLVSWKGPPWGNVGLGRDDQKKILKELPESVDGGANMETRVQQKKRGGNVEEKHRLSVQKFSSSSGKGKKFYLFSPPSLSPSAYRARALSLMTQGSIPSHGILGIVKKRNSHPPSDQSSFVSKSQELLAAKDIEKRNRNGWKK